MMDDGRSLAVTLLMVNDVPANQEIFEPLARKRRDCDWWIHDLMIETFLSDFKEEIVNIMMTAQTLAWRRKGAQGLFLVTAMFLGVNLLSREGYSQAGDRMKAFGMITTKKK